MVKLTRRQLQVLRHFCATGDTDEECGKALGIAMQTVRQHMLRMYEKTGLYTRSHLMLWAFHNGVAPCPCGALMLAYSTERVPFEVTA